MSKPFYKNVPSKAQVTKDAEEWLKHNTATVLPPGPSRKSAKQQHSGLSISDIEDLNSFFK